jgi:hypothetical protein
MGKENLLVLYLFVANVEKSLLFTLRPVLADFQKGLFFARRDRDLYRRAQPS